MTSLFEELKRRNVFRVAATYAVVAWIIIEAGSVLLPTFGASEAAFQVYVVVVVIGFLVSLVLAWIFEITSEGVKLEKNVDRSESMTVKTGGRLGYVLIALLVVALGISVTLNVTGLRDAHKTVPPGVDRSSIAVLPFTSRSTDPQNDLFTDGIHDDLLTRLANISALKVISRTSVMEYRDTKKNLKQVADELGVGTILEGAVQRVGNSVRITAQLIDAATDEHIWAKSYDHQLTAANLFAVQSEISEEIARALKATLSSEEQQRLTNIPTDSLAAYNLYTQGRDNLYKRRLDTLLKAREQFEAAIELDPNYADAYDGLADSVLLLLNNHQAIELDEAFSVAEASLDTALSLNPNLADAHASLGLLKHQMWQETRSGPGLEEAAACFVSALNLNSNDPTTYMWFASLRRSQQRIDEAIELFHESLRVDPLGKIPYANLPALYASRGQNDVALDLLVKAVEIHPDWPTAYQNLGLQLNGLGRIDEAVAWGVKGRELTDDPIATAPLMLAYMEFGEYDKVIDLYSDITPDQPMYEIGLSMKKALQLDYEGAAEVMENTIAGVEKPRQVHLGFLIRFTAFAGDLDKARMYMEMQNPGFAAEADLNVDASNVASVIGYAYILQNSGETERADALFERALGVVRTLPRLGVAGHGIRDVQILALQGKPLDALAALRIAIDEGFRGTVASNGWPLA
ncbi:MAG: hypothetical protein V7700_18535, partial [Halioglobus sp.]